MRETLELQPATTRLKHAAASAMAALRPDSDKNDARDIPSYAPDYTSRRQ